MTIARLSRCKRCDSLSGSEAVSHGATTVGECYSPIGTLAVFDVFPLADFDGAGEIQAGQPSIKSRGSVEAAGWPEDFTQSSPLISLFSNSDGGSGFPGSIPSMLDNFDVSCAFQTRP